MTRSFTIDNIRGIAFILMTIYHIFYVCDMTPSTTGEITNYTDNKILDYTGKIARTLFILLAGYSLYHSYKKYKDNFPKERVKRSFTILIHALIMSAITYYYYPDKFIRFGILHFIFLVTLLSPLFAPYKNVTLIIFAILLFINFPSIHSIIDTITGSKIHFSMMDWFPLRKNFSLLLVGLLIAQHFNFKNININFLEQEIPILTKIGQNTLNLYTMHFVILFVLINYLKR
jgi:uncharacterized membrane protein